MRKAPPGGAEGCVLVVDDEPSILDLTSELLEAEGYEVMAAADGESALALLDKVRPDVLILDIFLPGLDGFEICQNIQKDDRLRGMSVIFISGGSREDLLDPVLRAGGLDYLTKPLEREPLIAVVREAVSRSRGGAQEPRADMNAGAERSS